MRRSIRMLSITTCTTAGIDLKRPSPNSPSWSCLTETSKDPRQAMNTCLLEMSARVSRHCTCSSTATTRITATISRSTAERPEIASQPGLVFVASMGDGDVCITFKVFARFAEATNERPIPIGVTWNVDPDSEEAEHLKEWMKFGTPFLNPRFSRPRPRFTRGAGGTFRRRRGDSGPGRGRRWLRTEGLRRRRLRSVDRRRIAEDEPATRGLTGEGFRASGQEANGVFEIEIWMDIAAQK